MKLFDLTNKEIKGKKYFQPTHELIDGQWITFNAVEDWYKEVQTSKPTANQITKLTDQFYLVEWSNNSKSIYQADTNLF